MKKFKFLALLSLLTFVLPARAEIPPAASVTPPVPAMPPRMDEATSQPIDPAKEAEIRKLLKLTGTVQLVQQMRDQMISTFRIRNSRISEEFWDRFEKEINLNDLVERIIPIYAKYYSLDDLRALNAFYETPAGQRMLASLPKIAQESMTLGQEWGRSVATRLIAELKEEKETASSASAAAPSPSPAPARAGQ